MCIRNKPAFLPPKKYGMITRNSRVIYDYIAIFTSAKTVFPVKNGEFLLGLRVLKYNQCRLTSDMFFMDLKQEINIIKLKSANTIFMEIINTEMIFVLILCLTFCYFYPSKLKF